MQEPQSTPQPFGTPVPATRLSPTWGLPSLTLPDLQDLIAEKQEEEERKHFLNPLIHVWSESRELVCLVFSGRYNSE